VKSYCWAYANLDVIPGSSKGPRTVAQVNASAEQSYRNLQIMKDAGLKPLPVFHQMESFRWLERMLNDGEDFIGISTAKHMPNLVQNRWLDEFFSLVTDRTGRPLIKVHGFGSADVDLLRRHPFFSVDSAGWTIAGGYGKIYVPPYHNGKPNYLGKPELITVSGLFNNNRWAERRQFANLGRTAAETVRRFLEEEVGVTIEMARESYKVRWQALAVYYLRVTETIKNVRFQHRRLGARALVRRQNPIELDRFHFFFATSPDRATLSTLSAVGARNHLLSYWEIKNRPEVIEPYVMERKVILRKRIGRDRNEPGCLPDRGRSLAQPILQAG
jgi:hypothetical protein